MEKQQAFRLAGTCAVALSLAACGGGGTSDSPTSGDGTEPDDGSSGSSTTSTLEYFQGSLSAVQETAPSNVLEIDPDADTSGIGPVGVLEGDWDAQSNQATNLALGRVIYARTNGELYRVTTDGSSGAPTPQRISSESNATPLCGVAIGRNYPAPDQAKFAYAVGDTADCKNVSWKVVGVTADSGTTPKTFPGKPVLSLLDPSDGSQTGWLVNDGSDILETDPDGSDPTTALSYSKFADLLVQLDDGTVLFNVDGKLVGYDPETGNTIDPGHPFATNLVGDPTPVAWATDGTSLFWKAGDMRLMQFSEANGVQVLDDPANSDQGTNQLLSVGADEVAWTYVRDPDPNSTGDEETVLRVATKGEAGSGSDGATVPGRGQIQPATPATASAREWVFYNELASDPTRDAVARRLDNPSKVVRLENARWAGATGGILRNPLERMLFVDGLMDVQESDGENNLKSLPADSPGDTPINLGTIPADIDFIQVQPGLGPTRLAIATDTTQGGSSQSDVMFLDAAESQTLQRLTGPNDTNELPVFGF